MPRLEILYEDNHLLVVNKPAGIATMGAEHGEPTVHAMAAQYLKKTYHKPGRAYVGIVSRLDAMTSGVLVLARTSKAASRLAAQFAADTDQTSHPVAKIYLAAVHGRLDNDRGELVDFVMKDDDARRMRVVDDSRRGAQLARLRYLSLAADDDLSILAIELLSGRKHQIRVQFADRGHAVIGDRKYKSKQPFSDGIALHSWRLRIHHPTRRESMWFEAELPQSWKPFLPLLPAADSLRHRVDQSFEYSNDAE